MDCMLKIFEDKAKDRKLHFQFSFKNQNWNMTKKWWLLKAFVDNLKTPLSTRNDANDLGYPLNNNKIA